MQTTSFSLPELLRELKKGNWSIPQFQREFVWRDSQSKLLVDSVSRSYPIGSLLLLRKNPSLPLASRHIEAEIRRVDEENEEEQREPEQGEDITGMEFYILDGQQRTTSIARVFLNSHPKQVFYLDLKKILECHKEEDSSWIVGRRRGLSAPDRKDNNRLLRADLALDQEKSEIYVSEYLEDSGDFPHFDHDRKAGREAAAKIKRIFETIRNYKIPVVQLEGNSGLESICRIFETINSTGTKLGTFDLAVARFFPQPDLRTLWNESKRRWPLLEQFEVEGDRMLQVMYLYNTVLERRYADPSRGSLLQMKPDFVEREWEGASESLHRALEWAKSKGARPGTLPNLNVVTAMAGVLRSLPGDELWGEHDDDVRRWYFAKSLQSLASQASNYRIGQDFSALHRFIKEERQLEIPKVPLDSTSLSDIRPTDGRYKALLNVFAMTVREDLITGDRIDSDSDIHDHHVFPRNASNRHGINRKKLDSICNRVPILARTNMELGEAYPNEYMLDMMTKANREGRIQGLDRRMRDYLLPVSVDEKWDEIYLIGGFERFCQIRAKLILERIREIVGDALGTSTEDDETYEM